MPASSKSILSGYLLLKSGASGGGSKPVKRWFALLPDFVLYSFKSDEAFEALTATPIPGLSVLGGPEWKGDTVVSDKEKHLYLKLGYSSVTPSNNNSHVPLAARKTYYLMANSKEDIER